MNKEESKEFRTKNKFSENDSKAAHKLSSLKKYREGSIYNFFSSAFLRHDCATEALSDKKKTRKMVSKCHARIKGHLEQFTHSICSRREEKQNVSFLVFEIDL